MSTPSAVSHVRPSRLMPVYIGIVVVAAVVLGVVSWTWGRPPDIAPLVLLSAMGVFSFGLREPDVGSRVGFSFLSIILLASAAILGPFGSWAVAIVSVAADRRPRWLQTLFNVSMTAVAGAAGAWAYVLAQGASELEPLRGALTLGVEVGVPLMVADVVVCLTNAALLSGVIHFQRRIPFLVLVQRVLATSGVAYIGYGAIGFLFVILWYPAQLGPFSAVLVIVPLLAARWAFIQYGDEMRSHERTVDTLVTALGTREPAAVSRSRRSAQLAEWIAEEMGLRPQQIGAVRYAATLHEIGHLGLPARLLRRPPSALSDSERRVLERHGVVGARMIEGIDFLEGARSGIRHQGENFDGSGGPDGLAGREIPIAARIVAVAGRFDVLTSDAAGRPHTESEALRVLDHDIGRYDPSVLDATRAVLDKHARELPVPRPNAAAAEGGEP